MEKPAMHRAILVVDVEGFGDQRRTNRHQIAVRNGMYRVLSEAFSRLAIPWDDCYREDRGDGVLMLISPDVPKSRLTGDLPWELAVGLRRYNAAASCPEARMRLRVALHAGEVVHDDNGVVGSAVIHAFRLIDVPAVKNALLHSSGLFALIVSDWWFQEVVRHDSNSRPEQYERTQIAEKETRATAWIHVPDHPASRADVVLPGNGLTTLPPLLWSSAPVREAAASGAAGAVVAIARQAHGLSRAQLGAMIGLSKFAVGRLEAGGSRAYDMRIMRELQRLLGIPAHLLGLADQAVLIQPGAARQLLGDLPSSPDTTLAVDGRTLLSMLSVDTTDHLLVLRRVINDADNYGRPAALRPTVRELYEYANRLRLAASGEFRQQLLAVGAVYAEFYGWLYEETQDLHNAAYWTTQALQEAQAADAPDAIAYSYVRMAHLAALDSDNDRVLGLVRAALKTSGMSPVVRAMALRQYASGLACAGDAASLDRLNDAQDLMGALEPRQTDRYEIGYCFTEHHIDVQRAACLLELGRLDEAITHYERLRWGNVCHWERGVHTAKLAFAHAVSGDLAQTAAVASEARELARITGSATVARELQRLDPWASDPRIADITEADG